MSLVSFQLFGWWTDGTRTCAGFVPFITAFFTKDFFLGDTHNVVENKKVMPGSQDDLITPGDQETARAHVNPVGGQDPDVKRQIERS